MQFTKLWPLSRVRLQATEVVAVHVVDITGWRQGLRCNTQTDPPASQWLQLVVYTIPPMARKWCSPEHSLHVGVKMQHLELETTTVMYKEHDRCVDWLETQHTMSIMTTMVRITFTPHQGNKEQIKMS